MSQVYSEYTLTQSTVLVSSFTFKAFISHTETTRGSQGDLGSAFSGWRARPLALGVAP